VNATTQEVIGRIFVKFWKQIREQLIKYSGYGLGLGLRLALLLPAGNDSVDLNVARRSYAL